MGLGGSYRSDNTTSATSHVKLLELGERERERWTFHLERHRHVLTGQTLGACEPSTSGPKKRRDKNALYNRPSRFQLSSGIVISQDKSLGSKTASKSRSVSSSRVVVAIISSCGRCPLDVSFAIAAAEEKSRL